MVRERAGAIRDTQFSKLGVNRQDRPHTQRAVPVQCLFQRDGNGYAADSTSACITYAEACPSTLVSRSEQR
jgi:hypothetical protein